MVSYPDTTKIDNPADRLAEDPVNALINYLIEHLMLDFDGDLTLDEVRGFLRDDNSKDARNLLGKLIEDGGVSDMMIALADCLKEHLRTGISNDVVREQIHTYIES